MKVEEFVAAEKKRLDAFLKSVKGENKDIYPEELEESEWDEDYVIFSIDNYHD